MSVIIREAAPADADVITASWRVFHSFQTELARTLPLEPPTAESIEGPFRDFLRDMIASDNGIVLLAERGSRVIGWLIGELEREPFFRGEHIVGHIVMVHVDESQRRRGIARRLVETATRWFREQGAQFVSLVVLPTNRAADNFWEALGFLDILVTKQKRA